MGKPRVMYIVHHFPQISETYIRSEIEALKDDCEIRVVSLNRADYPYQNHVPYQVTDEPAAIEAAIEEFRPDILHTHWLEMARPLAFFAGYFSGAGSRPPIPFTIRTHSFDVLDEGAGHIGRAAALVNSDLCLGILAFPFARPLLEGGGVRPDKIHDCYPVVNYARFYDPSPNGRGVMNVGACLPKKQMEDYVDLACSVPDRQFDLYALGYQTSEMVRLNRAKGDPVRIVPPVEPEDMRAEYKKHEWLVYTANRRMNSVGWPMAVAEAQAAGVGVCLPNIRPDLREYVGDAGFLYESIAEVAELVRGGFPEELRQRGFEQAKKSDVFRHKSILLNLWNAARGPRPRAWELGGAPDGAVRLWGEGDTALEKRLRLRRAARELDSVIPQGSAFALVDEGAFADVVVPPRHSVPFPARDGRYWGPPADDAAAIGELARLCRDGVGYLAFGWPAFWWLDYYGGFHRHLLENFRLVLESDLVVVFDLNSPR